MTKCKNCGHKIKKEAGVSGNEWYHIEWYTIWCIGTKRNLIAEPDDADKGG